MLIRFYQVEGDLTASKSRDVYPLMALCDECVGNYTVIVEENDYGDLCEACGCEGNDE